MQLGALLLLSAILLPASSNAQVCGNGIQEGIEFCDLSDDSNCPGQCLPNCMCLGPVCGNGFQEASELCDCI